MRLSAIRTFNNIRFYGYVYPETGDTPYWTMNFYVNAWHAPEIWFG